MFSGPGAALKNLLFGIFIQISEILNLIFPTI